MYVGNGVCECFTIDGEVCPPKMCSGVFTTLLLFVRSIREGNFQLYLESLTKIVPWMFTLDHMQGGCQYTFGTFTEASSNSG